MNYGPLVFLAAFFALAGSWFSFVLTPSIQVGRLDQTNTVPMEALYPVARPGFAREGLDVYRATADELEIEIRRVLDRVTAERSSGAE